MMQFSGDNFVFKGFNPSDDLKVYCKEVYSRVEDKAPSESKKTASISKTSMGYEGSFHVASASGVFKANSRNREAKSLIDELYNKMSLQILDWYKTRDVNLKEE